MKNLVEEDISRNYFILLALESKRDIYDKIYGQWKDNKLIAVLLRRKSGTLQFYGKERFHVDGFVNLIHGIRYNCLIGPSTYCNEFANKNIFSSIYKGAYISKLHRGKKTSCSNPGYEVLELKVEDLEQVVDLYKKVFKSSAPKEIMEAKLERNRGRGVCIKHQGKIVSVAQTDFERDNEALIVGVATDPAYENKGLGTVCTYTLITKLQEEGKDLYLQYESEKAGKLYRKLGFSIIDQVYHYYK